MEFSRQEEYWNGLLFPTPGDLPDPGTEPTSPVSPALASVFFFVFDFYQLHHLGSQESTSEKEWKGKEIWRKNLGSLLFV